MHQMGQPKHANMTWCNIGYEAGLTHRKPISHRTHCLHNVHEISIEASPMATSAL